MCWIIGNQQQWCQNGFWSYMKILHWSCKSTEKSENGPKRDPRERKKKTVEVLSKVRGQQFREQVPRTRGIGEVSYENSVLRASPDAFRSKPSADVCIALYCAYMFLVHFLKRRGPLRNGRNMHIAHKYHSIFCWKGDAHPIRTSEPQESPTGVQKVPRGPPKDPKMVQKSSSQGCRSAPERKSKKTIHEMHSETIRREDGPRPH